MRKKIVIILLLSFSFSILLIRTPSASTNTIVVNCGEWWSTIPINAGTAVETRIAGYEIGGGRIDQATVNYGDGYTNTVTSTDYNGCGNLYQTPDIEARWFHSYAKGGVYSITVTLTDTINHLTSITSEGTVTVIPSQSNSTALSGKAGIKV